MSDPGKPGISLPRGRSPYFLWLIWAVWLPFSIPAITELLQAHPTWPRLLASLTGIALFIVIYLWATLRNAQRLVATNAPAETLVRIWLPIIVLTVLSTVLVRFNGTTWGSLFIFTAAYNAGRLPTIQAVCMLIVLLTIIALGSLGSNFQWADALQGIGLTTVVSVVVMSLARSVATERELRVAREEIARLAIMTERLRIARDLHDLLGHNLSLIALKSELARKLLKVAPERAELEISDVENVARTTLDEVREAVTNYRQPTLANELHAASEILAAAGIIYKYEGAGSSLETLPTALEAVLSWAVREGVTNVIRHSHAHHCIILVTRERRRVGVEVLDDGQGSIALLVATPGAGNGGNGLRGLRERVVTLGGHCETGTRAIGGFRLAVSVPLASKRDVRDTARSTI
ncbi:MAG TPA: sensor histidine kinase [Ktedonobacteraceae bacterium]